MNKTGFLFLGAIMAAGSFLVAGAGCGGGDTGSGGGTTGSGGSTATATGTGGTSTSTATTGTGTGTSTGTGMTATLDCTSYCGEVMTNCTAADAQYKSMDSCMGMCAGFKAPGMLADTTGDTLGCRIYHGGAPAISAPDTHCEHAGPTGGDRDVSDDTAGQCGEGCESFCSIAAKVCAAQYKDIPTCMTECKTFAKDAGAYSTADTDKNDFGCRMYHLSAAAESAMAAMTHCPHIVAKSAVCIN